MNRNKNEKWKKYSPVFFTLLIAVVILTFSFSYAKMAMRKEYIFTYGKAENFSFSAGDSYTFIIPYDGHYAVQLRGGDGGLSQNFWLGDSTTYFLGGKGGIVSGVAYFSKGTELEIVVGTKGYYTEGGFNGGGYGGSDTAPFFNSYYGGGGGGATDVRVGEKNLENRILVAGGAGGGSGGSSRYSPMAGGDGGTAESKFEGTDGYGEGAGHGGTMAEGGEGAQYGQLGEGGGGNYSGGGGGGGYYGGGGSWGSGGGGAGGSSYIGEMFSTNLPENLPGISLDADNAGDGYAVFTYLGTTWRD